MSLTSTLLLENTTGHVNLTGNAVSVDGGYGCSGYQFTVAIFTSNLQGTVHIEASVRNDPVDSDWFQATPALTFPRPGAGATSSGETASVLLNFPGNFAWIRARLSRPATIKDASQLGFVDRILLNR